METDYEKARPEGGKELPEGRTFIQVEFSRASLKGPWFCRLWVRWNGIRRGFVGRGQTKMIAWNIAVDKSLTSYFD